MKITTKKMMGLLAVAAPLVATQAVAEIEGSLTAGYSTDYEFRGTTLGEDLAEASVALSTEVNGFTIAGNVWYASTNDNNAFVDNEADYTLSVSKAFGAVNASLGYIYYSYPEFAESNTQEIFLTLSTEIYAGITGTVTGYYDFDLFGSWYMNADLGKSFTINDQLALNLNAGIGAYESDPGFADGMNHYYVKAGLAWAPKENLTVTPYVKYTAADSDFPSEFTALSGSDGTGDGGENVVGGVTISVAF
jgi:hypothetical protein